MELWQPRVYTIIIGSVASCGMQYIAYHHPSAGTARQFRGKRVRPSSGCSATKARLWTALQGRYEGSHKSAPGDVVPQSYPNAKHSKSADKRDEELADCQRSPEQDFLERVLSHPPPLVERGGRLAARKTTFALATPACNRAPVRGRTARKRDPRMPLEMNSVDRPKNRRTLIRA
jgi:hypothetical protein